MAEVGGTSTIISGAHTATGEEIDVSAYADTNLEGKDNEYDRGEVETLLTDIYGDDDGLIQEILDYIKDNAGYPLTEESLVSLFNVDGEGDIDDSDLDRLAFKAIADNDKDNGGLDYTFSAEDIVSFLAPDENVTDPASFRIGPEKITRFFEAVGFSNSEAQTSADSLLNNQDNMTVQSFINTLNVDGKGNGINFDDIQAYRPEPESEMSEDSLRSYMEAISATTVKS